MNILINLLLVLWSVIALLMILVILMQRPKSEGLGAAFGGGVTENIFGAQTTTVLTKFTGWLAGIFFALTFTLSVLYAHKTTRESAISRELKNAPAPATLPSQPPTTAPGAPAPATSPVAPAAGAPSANAPAAAPGASVRPSDQAVGAIPPVVAPPAPPASAPPQRKP
jgi:preprotein translocase subunit SecG